MCIEIASLPVLTLLAFFFRFKKKPFHVGIGPDPLINNRYHKLALEKQGYRVQTFVNNVYYITQDFDVRADLLKMPMLFKNFYLFWHVLRHYQALYFYFHGCALGGCALLWRVEPFLYRLANIKTVVMPYGGDVQELAHCPNLLYKHTISQDYPQFHRMRPWIAAKMDLWTQRAHHVIGGCDWVDYLYFWHTLTLSHIVVDMDHFPRVPPKVRASQDPFKILHAPNHRSLKGTRFFIEAVEALKVEGENVELVLVEKVSNQRVLELMREADLIADQLIIGWYAMFAIEGMAMGKPVLCYLRPDLKHLYYGAGLIEKDEIPLIECDICTVKEVIRSLLRQTDLLQKTGDRSREFVKKHHSTESLGLVFKKINDAIGIVI